MSAQVRGRGVPPSLSGSSGQRVVALLGLHRSETPAHPGNDCAPKVQCLKLVSTGHSELWAAGTGEGQVHRCVSSTALGWAAEAVVREDVPGTQLSHMCMVPTGSAARLLFKKT